MIQKLPPQVHLKVVDLTRLEAEALPINPIALAK